LDILNNILDRTHNYLILVEARNTGLIALNLGLVSFYYSSSTHLKIIVLMLCLLSTLILSISFINFNFKYENETKLNDNTTNPVDNEINIYNIRDIIKLSPKEYLNLVSNKMEAKGDKLINFIKKDYRFSEASKDLSEEIIITAKMCRFREKIFFIGLYLFIANIIILIIDNIIL